MYRSAPPPPHLQPPVPPLPSIYNSPRKSMASPQLSSNPDPPRPHSPSRAPASAPKSTFSPPDQANRIAVTPTAARQVSSGSTSSSDKPLPRIRLNGDDVSAPLPVEAAPRSSGHTRQAATIHEDDPSPSSSLHPSPQPPIISTLTDDVAGMLDGIGQSDPARELGLPPESLRSKDRRRSQDTRRFPIELGRTASTARRDSEVRPVNLLSPVPARRTSSLAARTPKSKQVLPHRSSSPNMEGEETDSKLSRNNSTDSSTSSRRRANIARDKQNTQQYATLSAAPLGSPLLISNGNVDFGPLVDSGDATIRAKPRSDDLLPLSPQSVRLISSPLPNENQAPQILRNDSAARAGFIATSPWGAQSSNPTTPYHGRMEDPLECVTSPVTPNIDRGEDDAERGRRLACEFLENDFSNVASDKVAMFLGGP